MELSTDDFPKYRNNPNFQTVPVTPHKGIHELQDQLMNDAPLLGPKIDGKRRAKRKRNIDVDGEQEVCCFIEPFLSAIETPFLLTNVFFIKTHLG